jgi:tRNA (guanine-N(7)-)-methyltransferase subunit TRM82
MPLIIQSVSGKPEKEDPAGKEPEASETSQEPPNIIKVKATSSGRYVVVVTAEDKAVRVFELSADGQLCHLGLRYNPLLCSRSFC